MSRRMRGVFELIPLKLSVVVISVSLWLGEWFPFSHFPMYARPSPATYFVYIAEQDEAVVPIRTEFGVFAAALKKVHKRHLSQVGSDNIWSAKACEKTLDYALDYREHRVRSKRRLSRVVLWAARVTLSGGKLRIDRRSCAETSVDEA